MTAPAITVEDISKRYLLGSGVQHASVTQAAAAALDRRVRRALGRKVPSKERREEFWALRDVSFEVEKGQSLGLIGANGAGKSTMLKLLAQITFPTTGRIELQGRLGSLLEVGTGFHPELTGRENIFLNGAILGMRRTEIMSKYDEIVEFSGVEHFLETPTKRYSSGMYMRLAFSVAVHLRPQILLVDEVLAVGDADFQRKCMAKMNELTASEDTTLIFVTHNTSWVRRICDRAVYLKEGRMQMEGPASEVVDGYFEAVEPVKHGGIAEIPPNARRSGTGEAKLVRAMLSNVDGEPVDRVRFKEPFRITLTIEVAERISDGVVALMIATNEGTRVLSNYSTEHGRPPLELEPGTHEFSAELDVTLLPGEFVIEAGISDLSGADIDWVENVLRFTSRNEPRAEGEEKYPWEKPTAYVRANCEWDLGESSPAGATVGRATG